MKVERVVVRHVRVPLRAKFSTAETERAESDSIIVEVVLEDGTFGFGEGVPREYLTAETPRTCFDFLRRSAANLRGTTFADFAEAVESAGELPFGDDPLRPQCAARAALEIALLDAAGQCFHVPLYRLVEFLPDIEPVVRQRKEVRYGVVLSAGSGRLKAFTCRLYGFRDAKLKVGLGVERDIEFVGRMRSWLGRKMDLRVDANGGWSLRDAPRVLRKLHELGVSCVEQPVRPQEQMQLAEMRSKDWPPVMLDESLVSERDAQLAIDAKLCQAFNLRVSKNGGLLPVMGLAALAVTNHIGIQLGCHPGETGILSAAGRAIACSVDRFLYLEGSYDRHLLKRNIVREDVTFGLGGRARRLEGSGLGVTVSRADLAALTVETLDTE